MVVIKSEWWENFYMNGPKTYYQSICHVITCNMKTEMKNDAINWAKLAIQENNNRENIAKFLKEQFDQKYPSGWFTNKQNWQCVVGSNYTVNLQPKKGNFIYFYIGEFRITLFKSV